MPSSALSPMELRRANDSNGRRVVDWACFGSLSPWEVVSPEGRKLVGLAQRRRQSGVLLVAGTLIGLADWPLLCDVMGHPEDERMLRRATVSVNEIAGDQIELERFASLLKRWLDSAISIGGEGHYFMGI